MIGGMGQRRPPTGPSPYTAGRPNPMAGFQGGGGGFKGAQPMAPWMRPPPPQMPPGGGGGVQVAQGQPPPGGWGSGGAPGYYPPGPQQAMPLLQAPMGMGGGGMQAKPYQGAPPGQMGGMQRVSNDEYVMDLGNFGGSAPGAQGIGQNVMPEGGMGRGYAMPLLQAPLDMGGAQGMSDAMMHPFAPRNRPQFMGAAQGGIMGGMGGGPQMGRRFPPQMPPWMQMQGTRLV